MWNIVKHSGEMLQCLWSGARRCDDVGKYSRRNHKHNNHNNNNNNNNSSEQQQQYSNQEEIDNKTIKTIQFLRNHDVLKTSIAWPAAISYQNRWSRSCAVELPL